MSAQSALVTGLVAIAGSGSCLPKFAKADIAAATTDGAVITAVSGKKILVLDFKLSTVTAATTATFNSKPAGAGTAISSVYNAPVGFSGSGFNQLGHFETNSGEGLTVTTGVGNSVGVQVTYIEV